MSELPILFKAEMVQAILAGRKTQTRRTRDLPVGEKWWCRGVDRVGARWYAHLTDGVKSLELASPFGGPGDSLWVKETWACDPEKLARQSKYDVCYPASNAVPRSLKLRSSLHMPRWASRLDLKIVELHVERLRSITWQDAEAEGVEARFPLGPVHEFRKLWESINGAASWVLNPLVWVVRFKR